MAKQTFTTGQVLTAAQMTSLQQTAMGGGSATAKTASYVLVAADAGTTVAMNAAGATTITVNTGLFAAGDTVFIQNLGAGACTVTAGTATVATAGSAILPQNDAGILYFTATGASIFYDFIQAGGASPLTTKGDLYTFSTSDARLPVGTNGQVLTADSSEATGLKFATPAGGAGLTLVKTHVIGSAVSAVTVTSAFSATYDAYAVIVTGGTGSVNDENITLQLGSTTTGYYAVYIGSSYATASSTIATNNNASNFTRAANVITNGTQCSFLIINPFLAKRTYLGNGLYGGDTQFRTWGGYVDTTTSYTAFTLTPTSGTLTGGTVFVYGYSLS